MFEGLASEGGRSRDRCWVPLHCDDATACPRTIPPMLIRDSLTMVSSEQESVSVLELGSISLGFDHSSVVVCVVQA